MTLLLALGAFSVATARETAFLHPGSDALGDVQVTRADDLAVAADGTLFLLDGASRIVAVVSPGGSAPAYLLDLERDFGLPVDYPVSSLWALDRRLILDVVGRHGQLMIYDRDTKSLSTCAELYALDDLVPLAGGLVACSHAEIEGPRLRFLDHDFRSQATWGELCPRPPADPIVNLGCLTRLAPYRDDAVCVCSLNSGEVGLLDGERVDWRVFRAAEPGWKMPVLVDSHRLDGERRVLDIETQPNDHSVFVLTAPIGIHGETVLETFRDLDRIEIRPLGDPFQKLVAGPGGVLWLFAPGSDWKVSAHVPTR